VDPGRWLAIGAAVFFGSGFSRKDKSAVISLMFEQAFRNINDALDALEKSLLHQAFSWQRTGGKADCEIQDLKFQKLEVQRVG
jgi:hypothetical protein